MEKTVEKLRQFETLKLNYTFKNIELLKNALTHSTYSILGGTKNNASFKKLRVIGDAVLKLVVSEYVIQKFELASEGILSQAREFFIKTDTTQSIAKILFGTEYSDKTITGLVEISYGIVSDPNFKVVPYHKCLKSIFGAIFMDAGGSKGSGIQNCMNLFQKLWKRYISPVLSLKSCFPVESQIGQHWRQHGIDYQYLRDLEACIGIEFRDVDVLYQAFIPKSFYDPIRNKEEWAPFYKPDYQRLEFLGDAVLGLFITEFMFFKYPLEDLALIVSLVEQQICSRRLMEIANQLKISKFAKTQTGTYFEGYDDILEAVVGAIYVDKREDEARQFILNNWMLLTELIIPESLSITRDSYEYTLESRRASSSKSTYNVRRRTHWVDYDKDALEWKLNLMIRNKDDDDLLSFWTLWRMIKNLCEGIISFAILLIGLIAFGLLFLLVLIYMIMIFSQK